MMAHPAVRKGHLIEVITRQLLAEIVSLQAAVTEAIFYFVLD